MPDVLAALDTVPCLMIAELFQKRFLATMEGRERETISSWKEFGMTMIQKTCNAKDLKDCRGISLLSTLNKWYFSCLTILAEASPLPHEWNQINSFGFRKEANSTHWTSTVQQLMSKGAEWHHNFQVWLLQADILKAFDNLHPVIVLRAMKAAGLPLVLIEAIMQEMEGLTVEPQIDGVKASRPVNFTNAVRQGGPEAPCSG